MTAIRLRIFLLIITNVSLGVNTKALIRLALLVFFIFGLSSVGYSQCDVGVKLIEVVPSNPGQNNGKINVEITAGKNFECKLYTVDSKEIKLLQEKSGYGTTRFVFDNLEPWKYYQIKVIYTGQNNFLCKERQLSDIIIEEK